MRRTPALICLGVLCAGTLWLEYKIAAALGVALFFFASRCGLGVLAVPIRTCASKTRHPGATLPGS